MITHKQAFYIRACEEFRIWLDSSTKETLDELEALGLVQDDPSSSRPSTARLPTDAGRQALAEYDAHFTTIERNELERLQALERKIAAFLTNEFAMDVALDFQTGRWTIERSGQSYAFTSLSDAMRKAFELFEVEK